MLQFFCIAHFSCRTFSMLYFFLFMLNSFHVAIFFVLYPFHLAPFLVLLHVPLISCRTFFVLSSFCVAIFLCCTFYKLYSFYFARLFELHFFVLHTFHIAPFCLLHSFDLGPFFMMHHSTFLYFIFFVLFHVVSKYDKSSRKAASCNKLKRNSVN